MHHFKFHPGYVKLILPDLMFVDDLLIFSATDPHIIIGIISAFDVFSKSFVLIANPSEIPYGYWRM